MPDLGSLLIFSIRAGPYKHLNILHIRTHVNVHKAKLLADQRRATVSGLIFHEQATFYTDFTADELLPSHDFSTCRQFLYTLSSLFHLDIHFERRLVSFQLLIRRLSSKLTTQCCQRRPCSPKICESFSSKDMHSLSTRPETFHV